MYWISGFDRMPAEMITLDQNSIQNVPVFNKKVISEIGRGFWIYV